MKSRADRFLVRSGVLTVGLLAGLAGAAAPRALAAEEDPLVQPFEIGLFGGLHFYDKQSGLGRHVNDPEGISPDTGGAFGLRLTYNFCRWVGVEGEGLIAALARIAGEGHLDPR